MIKYSHFILFFLFLFQFQILFAQIDTFQSGSKWLDNNGKHINAHGGGIIYFNQTYYWYGEHKIEGKEGNKAYIGVHVYSSKDLLNWKDDGIALNVTTTDSTHDIYKSCVIERPKVIFNSKTRKFVMWFHLELYGKGYDAARLGVAVSDNPIGPFVYLKSLRPNAKQWPINVLEIHKKTRLSTVLDKYCGGKGCLPLHPDILNLLGRDFESGQMSRDMNLFIDDDRKAYLIYSSEENSTTHLTLLTEDYQDYSDKYARLFINRYMEAPIIFKNSKGKYFFIGSDCTGWSPNAARSASASNIWGPWTELGNPCRGLDSNTTFNSQGNFVLKINNKKDSFIFMADRWTPNNAIDGKYIWLPLHIVNNKIVIQWKDTWNLNYFKK